MEKHYTFIKNNRVVNTLVFTEQNDELAQSICNEQGYDKFIWLDEAEVPHIWAEHNPIDNSFTEPTPQYLYSIGVLSVDPDAPIEEAPVE